MNFIIISLINYITFSWRQTGEVPHIKYLPDSILIVKGSEPWDSGSRILNGDIADIEDYPFYGLIISSRNIYLNAENHTSVNVHCGSSLISPNYFLTAFHCFMNNIDPSAWLIVMGLKDRCKSLGSAKKYRVVKVIPHPEVLLAYKTKRNDIAIVKVNRPVHGITPIKLPSSPPHPGLTGEVIGFGLVHISKPKGNLKDLPCPLQRVSQIFPNQLFCKTPRENIWGAFCLVDAERKDGAACRGDSGGPWIVNKNGEPVIAGVSSFGDSLCRVSHHNDHYTNVYLYLRWIHDVISGSSSEKVKGSRSKRRHRRKRSKPPSSDGSC